MKLLARIVNGFYSLSIFCEKLPLDVWLSSNYTSDQQFTKNYPFSKKRFTSILQNVYSENFCKIHIRHLQSSLFWIHFIFFKSNYCQASALKVAYIFKVFGA